MTIPENKEALARLIREAADHVQPEPGLDAIRSRLSTTPKETLMSTGKSVAARWLLGGLGGAVATAAVIGGVWLATSSGDEDATPGPAGSPTQTVDTTPSDPDGNGGTPAGDTVAVPAYYAGAAPGGLALYREFGQADAGEKLVDALRLAANGDPVDPDYRSLWPKVAILSAEATDDLITIDIGDTKLHERPSGMTEREAQLAIEQLIYTAQGTAGHGRLPVQFLLDGKHSDTVLGVPTSEPLANASVLKTLAHVNLTTPAEGDEIDGDTLEVSGVANSFEANVVVQLQRYEGTFIAFKEPITAEGWMDDKLFPFKGSFDISQLSPGKYILTATTDDPSGGAEGNGPYTDSKVITIK